MSNEEELLPLAEIAKQTNKTPSHLSKLAREGVITDEKRSNRWFANPDKVKSELKDILWNRIKFTFKDQSDDILNWIFGFIKFAAVIVFVWLGLEQGLEPLLETELSIKLRLLFCILSIPIIYFFVAFPRVLKVLFNASNTTNRLALLESRTRDLNNEVKALKKRLDNYE